jgi:hypothetical protein
MADQTTYYNMTKPTQGDLNWNVPLNANFDIVDQELHNQDDRIDNIVAGVTIDSEVIDARASAQRSTTYVSLDARLEDIELKELRKDVADTKTGNLTMSGSSGIIFGNIKFAFNVGLGVIEVTTV